MSLILHNTGISDVKAHHMPSKKCPSWLEEAVIYEIYPQSFLDTNGDGIGDLKGVIKKLDYVKSLGCNVIWLHPCFLSPFGDAGYDVSNFCQVAPRYGTNSDLVALFGQAHRRGMRVILDFVAGHTSIEHPWFKASASPVGNKHSNWYIWTDNVWSETGPEHRFVQGYSDRDGSYMTNFFHFQPALNFGYARPSPGAKWQLPVNHPDVRALRLEIIKTMRYWLLRGADGYRVDMAFSLVKNDPGHRETMKFWREVRKIFDRCHPECVLLSEWSRPTQAIPAGFHGDFLIHFGTPAYTSLFRQETERDLVRRPSARHSFFDRRGKGNIIDFLKFYEQEFRNTRRVGYICLPTGNHDISRISVGRSGNDLKIIQAFLLTMPGIPCLYNGDEIGMRHLPGLSKEGGYGRCGARTPMQWDTSKNTGFSKAAKKDLYLPIDTSPDRPTVATSERENHSLLNHWRSLTKLRAALPALAADSDFQPLFAKKNRYPFVYVRGSGTCSVLVALNPSGRRTEASFPLNGDWTPITTLGHASLTRKDRNGLLQMGPISYAIFKKAGRKQRGSLKNDKSQLDE